MGKDIQNGFTLVELMVAVVIMGLMSSIALPLYQTYAERTQTTQAITDMMTIQLAIDRFESNSFNLPDNLAQLGLAGMTDPWGAPYAYLRLDGNSTPGINGQRRKDRNLNPVNSDYDLYSSGPDGGSQAQFASSAARDDIVRANNGSFFGVAEDY